MRRSEILPLSPSLHEQEDPSGDDEGAAMLELTFDIAPAANFKFHTASMGLTVRQYIVVPQYGAAQSDTLTHRLCRRAR